MSALVDLETAKEWHAAAKRNEQDTEADARKAIREFYLAKVRHCNVFNELEVIGKIAGKAVGNVELIEAYANVSRKVCLASVAITDSWAASQQLVGRQQTIAEDEAVQRFVDGGVKCTTINCPSYRIMSGSTMCTSCTSIAGDSKA